MNIEFHSKLADMAWDNVSVEGVIFSYKLPSSLNVDLVYCSDDTIYISMIQTPEHMRGYGIAKSGMIDLCRIADMTQTSLRLLVEPLEQGVSKEMLEDFYRGLGFRINIADMPEWIRHPKKV